MLIMFRSRQSSKNESGAGNRSNDKFQAGWKYFKSKNYQYDMDSDDLNLIIGGDNFVFQLCIFI